MFITIHSEIKKQKFLVEVDIKEQNPIKVFCDLIYFSLSKEEADELSIQLSQALQDLDLQTVKK